jgi:hypothetical protein
MGRSTTPLGLQLWLSSAILETEHQRIDPKYMNVQAAAQLGRLATNGGGPPGGRRDSL